MQRKKKTGKKECMKRRTAPNPAFERMVESYEKRMELERLQNTVSALKPSREKNKSQPRSDQRKKTKSDEEISVTLLQGENHDTITPIALSSSWTREEHKEKTRNDRCKKNAFRITSKQEQVLQDVHERKKTPRELRNARDFRRFQSQRKRVLERMEGSSEGEADQSSDSTHSPRQSQRDKTNQKNDGARNSIPTNYIERADIDSAKTVTKDQEWGQVSENCGVDSNGRGYAAANGSENVTRGGTLGKLFGEPEETDVFYK